MQLGGSLLPHGKHSVSLLAVSKIHKVWSIKIIKHVGIHQTSIVSGFGMGSKRYRSDAYNIKKAETK